MSTSILSPARQNAVQRLFFVRGFSKLQRALPESSALFICDLQEKFRPSIKHFDEVIVSTKRVLSAAQLLQVPIMVTEQYPRGLGATVHELQLPQLGIVAVEKTQFSMCIPPVDQWLQQQKQKPCTVAICGIETHVCVEHTVRDLLSRGCSVHVLADGTSSRSLLDRRLSLRRMQQMGAVLSTAESLILEWTGDASHEKFRQLQQIIRDPTPDCGLADF